MLAARFNFSVGLRVTVPFNRYFKDKKKQEFKPVLFVGDSMIRFLTNVRNHVNVISLGGAKILHVLHVIETQLAECFIFVLVMHVETNNVNKIHIPEKSQLSKAKQDLDVLFAEIRKLQNQHIFAVVFSGCVYTKSQIINDRIDILNKYMLNLCQGYRYTFIEHNNIPSNCLAHQVHLALTGQTIFQRNMHGFI
jgi:cell division protein FtsB